MVVNRVLTSLENLENLEISGNFVTLENSGKTQGILNVLREFFTIRYQPNRQPTLS